MAIKTRHVAGRRQLEFSSYQEILDDVRALAAGPTRQLGNWSLGEICNHLAAAMDMAVDGATFRPGWLIRTIGPLYKKRFLSRPATPGFQLPPNATQLMPRVEDSSAGIANLEMRDQRILAAKNRKPHPIFGCMTDDEWDRLHCLHSAMHLSFIVPATGL